MTATQQTDDPIKENHVKLHRADLTVVEPVDGKKALRERIDRLEDMNHSLMKRCIAAEETATRERLRAEAAEQVVEDLRAKGPRVTVKAENGVVSLVAVVAGAKWGSDQRWTIKEFREALGI